MDLRAARWGWLCLLLVVACDRDRREARELLVSDGFVELEMTGDGPYRFEGIRGDYRCFGTVHTTHDDHGRQMRVDTHCQLRPSVCDEGDVDACVQLGSMHDHPNPDDHVDVIVQDRERATAFFTQACDFGSSSVCVKVGHRYAEGVGARVDHPRAATFYARACDAGAARGCFALGECAAAGRGVTRDPDRATRLFARACAGGHTPACAR